MALKKQVRELKAEVARRDEELETVRRNMKHTSIQEKDYEIALLREECGRLRNLCDEMRYMKQGDSSLPDAGEQLEALEADLAAKAREVRDLQEQLDVQAIQHKNEVAHLQQEFAVKEASWQNSQESQKAKQAEKKVPAKQLATLKKQLEEKEKEVKKA